MSEEGHQSFVRFRLILAGSITIGPGKVDLLSAIASTGSISAAGRSLGMSYKKAWHLLDAMNRAFREPLAETTRGGKGRGGARLTPAGEKVLHLYRTIEKQAAEASASDLAVLTAMLADKLP